MKIPKNVKIFGITYKVKLEDGVYDGVDKCCGTLDQDKKIICIDKTMDKFNQNHTFFHECIHAVLYETGCGHSLSILEEPIVDNISKFMAEFVNRRNKLTAE
jgi:Zn-dependent peptidase ImmA (M78 family)